ncbi:Hypothetical protein R9X50_00238500 [Acrodontium crateriforme]|uniref:Nuclear architecture-related protein 1 n=1 Tax=Acrodontium crateriforme TaxID=150365 RepID=A0AAQ3M0W1_9PEZI|nr:Hypothetical protein R9X50_00238500 [Acrodontium crateriforme]
MSSAILSADDLNDFISPGVACIKPVETLPKQQPGTDEDSNPYEVTTEDKLHAAAPPPPAQISLTDCLACAGCVTSAEAVLVSLQSHSEVLDTLDKAAELKLPWLQDGSSGGSGLEEKIFVASVSPQTRASLAATYNVSEREASNMISQLLSGPLGLRAGGKHGSGFTWVIDTNVMREACLVAAAQEVEHTSPTLKKPVLTSACPGWICYVEKKEPHILPHLSKLKSPQALTGTLIKSVLANKFGVSPEKIWHMAVMPCFDKKLEASRAELTSHTWHGQDMEAIRDVDCVITARELLMLAESRNISFPCLPRTPVSKTFAPPFPDPILNKMLFGRRVSKYTAHKLDEVAQIGTSGGYLHHILRTQQALHPGSNIKVHRGRNSDVAEYTVVSAQGREVFRAARYYGFRNIQNLVRRLKPVKASRVPGATRRPGGIRKPGGGTGTTADAEYAYVEVMACPGGCTNGGGQIKVGDVATLRQVKGTGSESGSLGQEILPAQREWLAKVDEAYWSASSASSDETDHDRETDDDEDMDLGMNETDFDTNDKPPTTNSINNISTPQIQHFLSHWSSLTGVNQEILLYTTYRAVESDVGKSGTAAEGSEVDKVSALAVAAGGGW